MRLVKHLDLMMEHQWVTQMAKQTEKQMEQDSLLGSQMVQNWGNNFH
jgi:hypothetical protein